jgi:hypothetical protein
MSFISVENALLLVWTERGIGPGDEPHLSRQALGLKDYPSQLSMWWAANGGTKVPTPWVQSSATGAGSYTCVDPVGEGPDDPPPADFNHWEAIISASG